MRILLALRRAKLLATAFFGNRSPKEQKAHGISQKSLRLLLIFPCLFLAACDLSNEKLIDNGIGTSLYTADLGQETRLLEMYNGYICQQAGLPTMPASTPGGHQCNYSQLTSSHWTDFLIQGMNDIDRRCDAYLLWLDARRRNSGALQKQISDTAASTAAIMGLASVSAKAISIAGIAFGLLRNSVDNYNSRLLLEIDNTTVSTIVLTNRNKFRNNRTIYRARSKPEVIYILRGYLRLCLPFAIEREINAFATQAVIGLSNPTAVSPLAANNVATTPPRQVIGPRPGAVERKFGSRQRVAPDPTVDESKRIPGAATDWENQLQAPDLEVIQAYLCIAKPAKNFGAQTRAGIVVYKSLFFPGQTASRDKLNEIEGGALLTNAKEEGPCDATKFKNVLERRDFANEANVNQLIRAINAKLELTGTNALPENGDLSSVRASIQTISKAENLEPNFPSLQSQVTTELLGKIAFDFF